LSSEEDQSTATENLVMCGHVQAVFFL